MKGKRELTAVVSSVFLAGLFAYALPPQALLPAAADSACLWWQVEKEATQSLCQHGLEPTLTQLSAKADKGDLLCALAKMDVLVRSGRNRQAAQAIEKLSACKPQPDATVASSAADFLIGREQWSLAKRFLELFPEAEPGWGYVFVKHEAEGQNPEALDAWLVQRQKANFKYWMKERLRFRARQGTVDVLLDDLASGVKSHPDDPDKLQYFIEALVDTDHKRNVEWLAQACKPRLAYEAYRCGEVIGSYAPAVAAVFYKNSLAMPYTACDQKLMDQFMRTHSQVMLPPSQDWQKILRGWTRLGLAQSYQKFGQSEKAQPLIEELSASFPDGLPFAGLAQLSGQVQLGSGARVIEKRIKSAEPKNENSSEYWLTRAQYYVGRKEDKQAVEAFEKAVSVAPPPAEDAMFWRSRVVCDYARYLNGSKGKDKAMRLLRREFDACPPACEFARHMVLDMVWYEGDNSHFLRADDEKLWSYLSVRKDWTGTEKDLLGKMARSANGDISRLWQRVELLSKGNATRSAIAGEVMRRNNEVPLAIAQLGFAVAHLGEGEMKKMARSDLFNCYLESNMWKEAEAIFPAMSAGWDPGSTTSVLGRLSVCAARSGQKEEALRLWRQKDALDRSDLQSLDELAKYGMKPALVAYYQKMSRQDPQSCIPAAALKRLQ